MTEVIMDAQQQQQGTEKCPQDGCIRPAPHEGMRHRYAPTKDLQPEPQRTHTEVPETDERLFVGPIESRPRSYAVTMIDEKRGLSVAWDTCSGAGGCGKHITHCTCLSGPKVPDYIQRWRDEQFPIGEPEPESPTVPDDLSSLSAGSAGEDADEDVDNLSDALSDADDEPVDDEPVEQTTVETENTSNSSSIDPEVGF